MPAPIAYLYHYITGEFLNAVPRPLDAAATAATGVLTYRNPPLSTPVQPPDAAEGHVAVFADGAWSLVPDHRGERWYGGGYAVTIDWPGDPAALGLTREAAPAPSGSAAPPVHRVDEDGFYLGPVTPGLDVPATESAGEVIWQSVPGALSAAPPITGAKEAARWTGKAWTIVPDHRGETWYDAEAKPVVIDKPGDPAALGLAPIAPALPREISAVELHLALDALGFAQAFEDAAAKLTKEQQIRLRFAVSFKEGDPLLAPVFAEMANEGEGDVEAAVFDHAKPAA